MPYKSCLWCSGILLQLPTEILRINLSARFFVLVTHKVFFILSQIDFGHKVNYLLCGVEWSVKIEFIGGTSNLVLMYNEIRGTERSSGI